MINNENNNTKETSTAMQVFINPAFGEVRSMVIEGEPWFVGKDVAAILGYRETAKAIRTHVDEDDKGVSVLDTPGGSQELIVINESGLYSLIFSSKLPKAKEFKHWVTSEVLPSIRKTGMYRDKGIPEDFVERFNVLVQTVSQLIEWVSPITLQDTEFGRNVWKKTIGTPRINAIADAYNIDGQEACKLVYSVMRKSYGFCEPQACENYKNKYHCTEVSTWTAIADNSIYQQWFVRSVNKLLADKVTESISIPEASPVLMLSNTANADCVKTVRRFKVSDSYDEVITAVIEHLGGMSEQRARNVIYKQMANPRQWKHALTQNRVITKKDLIAKSKTYKRRFINVCNSILGMPVIDTTQRSDISET